MEFGVHSDTGRIRENNEDNFRVEPEMNLFVLSDGMGGMTCGEVASRLTVDTVVDHCRESEIDPALGLIGKPIEGASETSNRLASAIRLANRIVHLAGHENMKQHGMGATVVAMRCMDERMSLAHAGDSRAYLFREGHLEQLTQDHSVIAEHARRGRISPGIDSNTLQNVLTRAVGADSEVEVDVAEEILLDGDVVLLCSDGLTRELSDAQIADVLGVSDGMQEAANRLVHLANKAGGRDNITAMTIRRRRRSWSAFLGMPNIRRWFYGSRS